MQRAAKLVGSAVLAFAALASTGAGAHGIWFAQRATQLSLIYGVGADDLDVVKRLPKVRSIAGYDEQGRAVPTQLRAAGPIVVVDSESPPAVVSAVLEVSETSYKYAVHLAGPLDTGIKPLPDQVLQIVPAGPVPNTSGRPLKLQVIFQGKPVAGAQVLADYVNEAAATPVKTAADGTVTIKVRNQGLNVISATYESPAGAQKTAHRAALSFVLPHGTD